MLQKGGYRRGATEGGYRRGPTEEGPIEVGLTGMRAPTEEALQREGATE